MAIAKGIYVGAHSRFNELTAPYATVIEIKLMNLPSPEVVARWTSPRFVAALRHDLHCPEYNPQLRQLIHVGFKIAAELGSRYTSCLKTCADIVGANVSHNLLERHIKPIFG